VSREKKKRAETKGEKGDATAGLEKGERMEKQHIQSSSGRMNRAMREVGVKKTQPQRKKTLSPHWKFARRKE